MKNLKFLILTGCAVLIMNHLAFATSEMKQINTMQTEQVPTVEKNMYEIQPVVYKAEGLRDPFKGVVIRDPDEEKGGDNSSKNQEVVVLPKLDIQGVVWGTNNPQAIINNKVLKIGESVDDVRIKDVKSNGIVVVYKNKEFLIASPGGINKSTEKKPKGGKDGK